MGTPSQISQGKDDEAECLNSILAVLMQWDGAISGAGDKNRSKRHAIQSSIHAIRIQLPKTISNPQTDDDNDIDVGLGEFEESVAQLRRQIHSYQDGLSEELSDLLSLKNEVETLRCWSTAVNARDRVLLALSLISTAHQQIQRETRVLRLLSFSLDRMYTERNTIHQMESLDQALRALSRAENNQQRETLTMIHELEGHKQDVDSVTYLESVTQHHPLEHQSTSEGDYSQKLKNDTDDPLEHQTTSRGDYSQKLKNDADVTSRRSFKLKMSGMTSVVDIARAFLDATLKDGDATDTESISVRILVTGEPGSGKTLLCSEVEKLFEKTGALVIRPRLPLDMLGSSVGDVEDSMVSIYSLVNRGYGCTVVLLDDVDILLRAIAGNDTNTSTRSEATLLAIIDALDDEAGPGRHVMFVGFSSFACEAFTSRCDTVLSIDLPSEQQRRELFTQQLSLPVNSSTSDEQKDVQTLLNAIVEATVGRSYAELNQLCRQAVEVNALVDDSLNVHDPVRKLKHLSTRLSSSIPQSLKSGLIDDLLDMRILTAGDLFSSGEAATGPFKPDLFGHSAKEAWSELVGSIVLPLCRSKEFHLLMDKSSMRPPQKILCGGVLLTGSPMSGKTFLSYACCRYAATLNPNIKVLDVSCTSLIHKEVGGSERAVRRLFDCARKAAPCIIVMDAIENIAAVRGHDTTTEGTLDRILSTLLVELDGVDDMGSRVDAGVAVIGITHDSSLVDTALLRPGRLGKVLELHRDW